MTRWVVIGAGAAGCVVAARLAEVPGNVVTLVEAGPGVAGSGRADEPGRLFPGPFARGRGIGGSGAVNGMLATPGDPGQYERWGWTDAGDALARVRVPLEIPADDELGPLDRALLAAAPDATKARLTRRDGQRVTASDAYLAGSDVTLVADAEVTAVACDGRRAVGVHLGVGRQLDAERVVVAAGAIGSPVLLAASGVDPPGLGDGLRNHPGLPITLRLREGVPSGSGLLVGALLRRGDVQVLPVHEDGDLGRATLLVVLLAPTGRGTVSTSPDGVVVDHVLDGHDRARLDSGRAMALELLGHPAFRDVVDDVTVGTAPAMVYHPTSTCAMGTVVDEDGAVVGYDGLHVVDASVFPDIPWANTYLPTLMLAERLGVAPHPPMSVARGPDLDVAVVGDGPAGLALAAACRSRGLAVVVVGQGRPWTATYGMWRDEVDLPDHCFGHVSTRTVVEGHRHHDLVRAYAIVDDAALRDHLADGLDVRVGRASGVQHFIWGSRLVGDAAPIDARLVVDASGRPSALTPGDPTTVAQTAFGVVVADPPVGFDRAAITLMDLRPLPGRGPAPTFCYVVPVDGGWLVEETVLAGRPPVSADVLRARLEARIGPDGAAVVDGAPRVERVTVPMGGPGPARRSPVVAFGASAGFTHPATGFSVAASLRAAPRVAAAIADDPRDVGRIWDAVWPPSTRRTRRLHDYGLEVLLGMDGVELATFFDAFFDLPEDVWAPYLRIDASPGEVSRTMTAVLRRLPWAMRRRLVVNPLVSAGGR